MFLSVRNRIENLTRATAADRTRRRLPKSTPNPDLPVLHRRRRRGRARESNLDLWAMGVLIVVVVGGVLGRYYGL